MSRTPAHDRLGRLLAIVPWVAAHDGPLVAEVCERFGVSEAELLEDLGLLFLCGVYPFTPDALIEVDVADGRVWIRYADYFARPLRLTPQEGLALISAGSALLNVPGADRDGALASALAKVETVVGVGADDALDVDLGPAPPGVLDSLRAAMDTRHLVRIDYYSFGHDGHNTRVVAPWRVFNSLGQWYLSGWCHLVNGQRLFRVDRIASLETLDEHFDPPVESHATPRVFAAGADTPAVVLDLEPAAHWVAEQYPNEGVEKHPDGRLRVTLRVAERAWLERLLLRAGRAATVVEGDRGVVSEAARRVLRRYG
ncbi:MAG: helix-turn-helix transcriptional regulator [Acidimicrobiales bacterium]